MMTMNKKTFIATIIIINQMAKNKVFSANHLAARGSVWAGYSPLMFVSFRFISIW
jgi:hypothetical protein